MAAHFPEGLTKSVSSFKNALLSCTLYFLLLMVLALPRGLETPEYGTSNALSHIKYSLCCSFPCQNGGKCWERCHKYVCDCSGTDHYGTNCQHERFSARFSKYYQTLWKQLDNSSVVKDVVNSADVLNIFVYSRFVSSIFTNLKTAKFSPRQEATKSTLFNANDELLLLSPVPVNCPLPMGEVGPRKLPSIESVFEVLRRNGNAIKSRSKANLLFLAFAHFLTEQAAQCNPCAAGVGPFYGKFRRKYTCGKIDFAANCKKRQSKKGNDLSETTLSDVINTIIHLEHNRVCDILAAQNPQWNDHKLFEAAHLVVSGEILTIALTEWLPIFSDFRFKIEHKYPTKTLDPTVPFEVKLGMYWPQMMPDGPAFSEELDFLKAEFRRIPRNRHYRIIRSLAETPLGRMEPGNIPSSLERNTKLFIFEGRKMRLQSFNNYRAFLGLKKYASFEDLISCPGIRSKVEEMYGNVDGLELAVGLLVESAEGTELLGETAFALVIHRLFKYLVTHPMMNVALRRKAVFLAGDVGWEIVKRSNIKSLICNNVIEEDICKTEGLISFVQPVYTSHDNASQIRTCPMVSKTQHKTKDRVKVNKKVLVKRTLEKPQFIPVPEQKTILEEPNCPSEHTPIIVDRTCERETSHEPPAEESNIQRKRCCVKRPWFRSK